MIGAIALAFVAFCGQRVDNLLLSYLTSKSHFLLLLLLLRR